MSNGTNDVRLKDQFFLLSIGLVVISLMALFFLGISWGLGGDVFFAGLSGKQTMLVLLITTAVGTMLALALRDKPVKTEQMAALHTHSSAA